MTQKVNAAEGHLKKNKDIQHDGVGFMSQMPPRHEAVHPS